MNIKINPEIYNSNKNTVSYNLSSNNFYAKNDIIALNNSNITEINNSVKEYMNLFFTTFFSIKDELRNHNNTFHYDINPYIKHFIQNIYSTNISSQITLDNIIQNTEKYFNNKNKDKYTNREPFNIEEVDYSNTKNKIPKEVIQSLKSIHNYNKKEQELLLLKAIAKPYFTNYTSDIFPEKTNTFFKYINSLNLESYSEIINISNKYAEEIQNISTILNNKQYTLKKECKINRYNSLIQDYNKEKNNSLDNSNKTNNNKNKNKNIEQKERKEKIITSIYNTGTNKNQIQTKIPNITLSDVIGLKRPKKEIQTFIYSKEHPKVFQKYHARGHAGILLHGKPGNGKTRFAQAIANTLKIPFMNIQLPDILSKYYGESEQILQEYFNEGQKYENLIMFFDEIDAISNNRNSTNNDQKHRGLLNVLLTNLDGFEKQNSIIPIASTNIIEQIDPALKRNGRFSKIIEIPNPEQNDIIEMYKYKTIREYINLNQTINTLSEENYTILAKNSLNFSFANINEVIERTKDNGAVKSILTKREYKTTFEDILDSINQLKEEIKFQ